MFTMVAFVTICSLSTAFPVTDDARLAIQETLDFYAKVSSSLTKICSTILVFTEAEEDYRTASITNKIISFLSPCPVLVVHGQSRGQNLTINSCDGCTKSPKHIFIFAQGVEELKRQLDYFNQSALLNVRSYMFFVVCNPVNNVLWLNQTMKQIWKYNILHFSVSYYHSKFEAVTYNPFFDKTVSVNKMTSQELYKNKLHDMNGYELRVGFFSDPPRIIEKSGLFYGIDAMVLEGFGKKLNATINYTRPGYATIIDEKYLKHFFQVNRKQIDFGFVSCFAIDDKPQGVTRTYPRRMDGIVVLIPHSSTIPQFYYMFMMFDQTIWIYLCISFFVVAITEYCHLRCLTIPVDLLKIFLEKWGAMFSVPVTAFQRLFSVKMLLLLWIIGCVTLSIHFQSLLTSELVTSKFEHNMDTLVELKENNTVIVINRSNARAIAGQYPQRLVRSWSEHRVIEKITNGDTTAAYAIQSSVAELISLKKTEDGYPVYHIIKELLVPGYTAYLFPEDSPYLDEANK